MIVIIIIIIIAIYQPEDSSTVKRQIKNIRYGQRINLTELCYERYQLKL